MRWNRKSRLYGFEEGHDLKNEASCSWCMIHTEFTEKDTCVVCEHTQLDFNFIPRTGSQGSVDPAEEGADGGGDIQEELGPSAQRLCLIRSLATAGLELRRRHTRVPGKLQRLETNEFLPMRTPVCPTTCNSYCCHYERQKSHNPHGNTL